MYLLQYDGGYGTPKMLDHEEKFMFKTSKSGLSQLVSPYIMEKTHPLNASCLYSSWHIDG